MHKPCATYNYFMLKFSNVIALKPGYMTYFIKRVQIWLGIQIWLE